MSEWISVKDSLPEKDVKVLACDPYTIRIAEYGVGYLENDIERLGWWIDQNFDWDEVTHWMPLPDNPNPQLDYWIPDE